MMLKCNYELTSLVLKVLKGPSRETTFHALFALQETLTLRSSFESREWDVAHLVRASDRHATDAGSIPLCGKEFFSQGQLTVQTLFWCPYTPLLSDILLHLCAH